MAFNAATGEHESLQCLALAGLQEIGSTFDVGDLKNLMLENYNSTIQQEVEKHTVIDRSRKANLKRWAEDPSSQKTFDEWLNSSVWVAQSVLGDRTFFSSGSKYTFYRQDQFPGPGKSFKDIFDVLKKEIKTAMSKSPTFARTNAGKIYQNITLNSDKWNPADIVAVKDTAISEWERKLSPQGFLAWRKQQDAKFSMKDDLKAFAKSLGKRSNNRLKIVEEMEHLYEYNKLIGKGMGDKEFIPISLKKAVDPGPKVQTIFVREPRDLEKYFHMKVDVSDVRYNPDNQKAEVDFRIENLAGTPDGKWSFDIRGFETTRALADIQIGLLKEGGAAYQGKITLPVSTQQIKLSGGNAAFKTLDAKKKQLLSDVSKDMKQNLKSSIHGFTDYRIFENMASRSRNFNVEMRDVQAWGDYVNFLSGGKTKKNEFIQNSVSKKFYDKMISRGLKAGKDYSDVSVSHTQAKYMKNKVQSYEMAWVIDPNGSQLNETVKDNILKSMWMYAASKGFAIFKTPATTAYLLGGSYIKCAA